jgi:acetyl-CoA carboxylase carboxyltransferase component
MTSEFFTTLISELSRPSIAIICGIAVAGACFIPASAPIAIPVAGGVVVAYMGGKSLEKITATKTSGATDIANANADTK